MAAGMENSASSVVLVMIGISIAGLSGVPTLFLRRGSTIAQRIALILCGAASFLGITGALLALGHNTPEIRSVDWNFSSQPCEFGIDSLSAIFILLIFLISFCCALYANGYWPAAANPLTSRRLTLFFGILTAALVMLVIARNALLFLIAWEIMALSAYFVLTTEETRPEVREAGTLYMIVTHFGTLALFTMFALLYQSSGTFNFSGMQGQAGGAHISAVIYLAALVGFGLKAGMMPLHIWLPSAHANAPSHISALMSGVLIKTGIYGLLRILSLFNDPPVWWGITLLILGIVSGVAGVAFAVGQHDLKRLLAYHSIENIGIIIMGIGLAMTGLSVHSPTLVLLGMGGALLHTVNHAIFKALLFLGAGSLIHAADTREIDLLGGIGRRMPWTSLYFLTGAVAICGLPPLNGFVSEFLIYLGLFNGLKTDGPALPVMALAAPALALIGGLAVICFVKVYGTVFLGTPRSHQHVPRHESPPSMLIPMGVLASLCIAIGLLPRLVVPLLEPAISVWAPSLVTGNYRLAAAAPLGWISLFAIGLILAVILLVVHYFRKLRESPVGRGGTWDCGYALPTPRMQYTAASFAEMTVKLSGGLLRPHEKRPAISGLFPAAARFASHVPEAVLELVYLPLCRLADARFARIRRLQHGELQLYILYVFLTLVGLLLWAMYFS